MPPKVPKAGKRSPGEIRFLLLEQNPDQRGGPRIQLGEKQGGPCAATIRSILGARPFGFVKS